MSIAFFMLTFLCETEVLTVMLLMLQVLCDVILYHGASTD